MSIIRIVGILFLIVIASSIGGCTTFVSNDFSTVLKESKDRGSTWTLDAPLEDAVPLFIATVERSNFKVHSSATKGGKVRVLLSQGTTLMSWGEVGHIDLSGESSNTTHAYVRIEHLRAAEGYPSADNRIMPDWMKDFGLLKQAAQKLRLNDATKKYRVLKRTNGKELDAAEGGGVMIGLLFGGPIGAAMAANAEGERGKRIPYQYALVSGSQEVNVLSFVPIDVGRCIALADNELAPVREISDTQSLILLPIRGEQC